MAEAVGVSRRTLDRAFRTHLGRSVINKLNRKRIERCGELLTGTRQSVVSIARQVGFRTSLTCPKALTVTSWPTTMY